MNISIDSPSAGELIADALVAKAETYAGLETKAWLYELAAEALEEARSRAIGHNRRDRYRTAADTYRTKAQDCRATTPPV